VRFLVLAAAILFVLALAALTALQFSDNGVTLAGLISVGVVVVIGVGVIGAAFHQPRKPPRNGPPRRNGPRK
jgi:hypothetical protein